MGYGDVGEVEGEGEGGKGKGGGFVMRMGAIFAFDVLLGKRVVLTEELILILRREGGGRIERLTARSDMI